MIKEKDSKLEKLENDKKSKIADYDKKIKEKDEKIKKLEDNKTKKAEVEKAKKEVQVLIAEKG